jgi:hypothetical protein
MLWRPSAFVLGAFMLLVACSGHSDGVGIGPPVSSPTPQASGSGAPSPHPSGSGTPSTSPSPNPSSTATAAPGTASLTFKVERNAASAKRRPMSGVPAAAQTLVVTINSVNGNTTLPAGYHATTNIALSGTNCTADTTGTNGLNCAVTIPAPPGSVNYTFDVYDANNDKLATVTTTQTVTGSNPSFSVTLNSIVASLQITPPSFAVGHASSGALVITYYDASGAQIVGGTFANSVTITDTDPNSPPDTQLELNGGTPGATVTLTGTGDTVTVTYDGATFTLINLTYQIAGGSGSGTVPVAPAQAISFSNTTVDATSGDVNYGAPTLYFASTGQQRSFTASETGWSDAGHSFTYALDPTSCGSGASAVAAVTTTDNLTFNVTAQNAGICKVTVTGAPGQSAVLWLSVTTGTGTIQ